MIKKFIASATIALNLIGYSANANVGPTSIPRSEPVQPVSVSTSPEVPASTPTPASAEPVIASEKPRFRRALGLLVNTASSFKFSSVKASAEDISGTGTATYNVNPAVGLVFSLSREFAPRWEWFGAVSYEFAHSITSVTVNANDRSLSGNYTSVTLSAFEIAGGVQYAWSDYYVPIGLNYYIPSVSKTLYTISPGFGGQIGLGFKLTDKFLIDVLAKMQSLTIKGSEDEMSIDFGTGHSYAAHLRGFITF